jgi:hypothetical protein
MFSLNMVAYENILVYSWCHRYRNTALSRWLLAIGIGEIVPIATVGVRLWA